MAREYEHLRGEVLGLEAELKKIIDEAEALLDALHSPGPNGTPPVGLSGNLVDSEGFPRGDVDVVQIRQHRHRLAVLRTDRKDVEARMEKKLLELHEMIQRQGLKDDDKGEKEKENRRVEKETQGELVNEKKARADQEELVPFAMVDEVMNGSPAEDAGLRVGDRVVRFGKVKNALGSGQKKVELKEVAAEASENFGKEIPVWVMRESEKVELVLVPRQWEGRGALGCHLMPL